MCLGTIGHVCVAVLPALPLVRAPQETYLWLFAALVFHRTLALPRLPCYWVMWLMYRLLIWLQEGMSVRQSFQLRHLSTGIEGEPGHLTCTLPRMILHRRIMTSIQIWS